MHTPAHTSCSLTRICHTSRDLVRSIMLMHATPPLTSFCLTRPCPCGPSPPLHHRRHRPSPPPLPASPPPPAARPWQRPPSQPPAPPPPPTHTRPRLPPHVRPGLGRASPPQHARQCPVSAPRGDVLHRLACDGLCSKQPLAAPLDEQSQHVDVSVAATWSGEKSFSLGRKSSLCPPAAISSRATST